MHYILIENPVFGLAIRVFTPSFIVRRLGKLLMKWNFLRKVEEKRIDESPVTLYLPLPVISK